METEVETPYIKLWKEDGILFGTYVDKLTIDLEIAKKCVETRIKYSGGLSYPCLIDIRGLLSVTKEAREYMADEGSRLITAGALITGNPVTKILANIFSQINKPKVPLKFFTSEQEAKEWLKQYL